MTCITYHHHGFDNKSLYVAKEGIMRERLGFNYIITAGIIWVAALFFSLGFSPILAYTVATLTLTLIPIKNVFLRFSLVAIFILGIAIQISSRQLFVSSSDDFSNVYIVVYNNIVNKNMSPFYGFFSGGIEFGLPLLFKFFSYIFGKQTYQELMLCLVILNCVIFYYWLEFFAKEKVSKENLSFFIAIALFIFSSNVTSQLIRQSYSTCFLLFAISFYQAKDKKYLVFLFLAFIFHVTALPFFFLYNIILGKNDKIKNIIAVVLFLLSISFLTVFNYLYGLGVLGSASQKLEYYLAGGGEQQYFIDGLKYVMLNFIVGFFFIDKEKYPKEWNLIKYCFIYYVLLIPIPLASERGLLLIVTFLPGVLMYFAFNRFNIYFKILFVLFVLSKSLKLSFLYSPNPDDVFNLWFYYPWASDTFLYYMKFFSGFIF